SFLLLFSFNFPSPSFLYPLSLHDALPIYYFVVPYGALILALPFILWFGSSNRRLRPLLLGFWFAFLFGLGGTTPVPKWIFGRALDRKSTRLNSSHGSISYAVFCLKKKNIS